jgi:hypothetical protein
MAPDSRLNSEHTKQKRSVEYWAHKNAQNDKILNSTNNGSVASDAVGHMSLWY